MTTGRINQVASRVERPALLLTHSTPPTDAPLACPATLQPRRVQDQKLARCLADSYSSGLDRSLGEVSTEPSPPAVPYRKSTNGYRRTTSVRQVVTGHLHLGAIQPPCILKLRSGRYDIVNLLTTHLRRRGPEDPHRSSLSRDQHVSLDLCMFWEQHKSAEREAAVVRPL